jgi:hypothetical protein
MKKIVVIALLVMFLVSGCKQLKLIPGITTDNQTVITETVRDTIILFKADSSFFRALLECDSNRQIILRQLDNVQGNKVKQDIVYRNKILTVQAKVDSQAVYLSLKDRYQQNTKNEVIVKEKIVKVYPKWMLFLALIGAGLLAYLGYKIFIRLKKILV